LETINLIIIRERPMWHLKAKADVPMF